MARDLLLDETPLVRNCGQLCSAACCQGSDTEGMLLFPGEEELYENCSFGRVLTPGYSIGPFQARLFVCNGTCEREQRPLACRLFPLFPKVRDGAVQVVMDPRARPVCPLCRSGLSGLRGSFVDAVRAASAALVQSRPALAYLEALTDEIWL